MVSDPRTWTENKVTVILNAPKCATVEVFQQPNFLLTPIMFLAEIKIPRATGMVYYSNLMYCHVKKKILEFLNALSLLNIQTYVNVHIH